MKKKIIIIISLILSITIGIIIFIFLNSKNLEQNISTVNSLLAENNYEEVYNIINDNKLLKKANDEIIESIEKNIYKYKVNNINSLLDLSNEDWQNIENLNNLITNLSLDNKNNNYQYLKDLLKIKENYNQYFNSVRWINSNEYEQYQMYNELDNFDENTLTVTSSLLSKYSFEKYDLTSTYIKELNEETKKLASGYNDIATALKRRDNNLLDAGKTSTTDALTTIASIQVEILLKSSEIETAIKKLPTI